MWVWVQEPNENHLMRLFNFICCLLHHFRYSFWFLLNSLVRLLLIFKWIHFADKLNLKQRHPNVHIYLFFFLILRIQFFLFIFINFYWRNLFVFCAVTLIAFGALNRNNWMNQTNFKAKQMFFSFGISDIENQIVQIYYLSNVILRLSLRTLSGHTDAEEKWTELKGKKTTIVLRIGWLQRSITHLRFSLFILNVARQSRK